MNKIIWMLLFSFLSSITINAQDIVFSKNVISNAGNSSYIESGLGLSWTLGEPVVGKISNNFLILTQGFQQGNKIIEQIVPVIEMLHEGLKVKVFPNPTASLIYINVVSDNQVSLSLLLHDLEGKLLRKEEISSGENQLPMHSLPNAMYLLTIIDNYQLQKTIKIQKIGKL